MVIEFRDPWHILILIKMLRLRARLLMTAGGYVEEQGNDGDVDNGGALSMGTRQVLPDSLQ